MKIYRDPGLVPEILHSVVTIGTFDGVHLGHRKIITRLTEVAKQKNGTSVVVTFNPHPRIVLFPEQKDLRLLTSSAERAWLLEKAGIDILLEIPFTKEFSKMSGNDFISEILVRSLKTKDLIIGYDHHFGRDREGSFEHLKNVSAEMGFKVEEIPARDVDHAIVSSTRIRKALQQGEIKLANENLGYPYFFSGTVVHGNKLGRTIGFPTANLQIDDQYKLIPAHGIYACMVTVGETRHKGMLSIGVRPTVGGTKETIEVFIMNFNEDLYGKEIRVHVIEWLRSEEKFDSLDDLVKQIKIDQVNSERILENV